MLNPLTYLGRVTLGDDAATKKTTSNGSYTNIQINSTTANTVYATVKARLL